MKLLSGCGWHWKIFVFRPVESGSPVWEIDTIKTNERFIRQWITCDGILMVVFRPAELTDRDAVLSLAVAFAASFSVEASAFDASFATLLQSPDAFVGVAAEADRIVGYLLGFDHYTFYANGRVAWVEEIMVAPDVRLHGVGRLLMENFEQWARSRCGKLIALATRRAEPFYRRLGYDASATYLRKLL
jgi:GNAT superfamily N-acetyltransferase